MHFSTSLTFCSFLFAAALSLIVPFSVHAQDGHSGVHAAKAQLTQLRNQRLELSARVASMQHTIDSLQALEEKLALDTLAGGAVPGTITKTASVYDNDDFRDTNRIGYYKAGDTIQILDATQGVGIKSGFWKVDYEGQVGYVIRKYVRSELASEAFGVADVSEPVRDNEPMPGPEFEGTGVSSTSPFYVDGPWYVRWEAEGRIGVFAFGADDTAYPGLVVSNEGGGSGRAYVARGGRFYFKVVATDYWHLRIERAR